MSGDCFPLIGPTRLREWSVSLEQLHTSQDDLSIIKESLHRHLQWWIDSVWCFGLNIRFKIWLMPLSKFVCLPVLERRVVKVNLSSTSLSNHKRPIGWGYWVDLCKSCKRYTGIYLHFVNAVVLFPLWSGYCNYNTNITIESLSRNDEEWRFKSNLKRTICPDS